jgi:hypothetical protein
MILIKHLGFSTIKSLMIGMLTFMAWMAWANLNGADFGDLRRPESIRVFIAASVTLGSVRLLLVSLAKVDEVIDRVREQCSRK